MTDLKTSETLLEALRKSASNEMSADELNEQRVSFIMGSMRSNSPITRAQVQELLAQHEGKKAS